MTAHQHDTPATLATLARRAADELAQGSYDTASAVALVAIAGALVEMLPTRIQEEK